jgi:TRAP-type C4-dicarboxylate transport system permease small subunit
VLTGPLWVRNDLRQDLPKLALLRSYPLRGARVVAAQVVSSVVVLSALQYVLFGISYVALLFSDDAPLDPRRRGVVLAALVVGLPVLNAASLTIQNGIALLFPSWVRLGPSRPNGVEAMGQNLLTTLSATVLLAFLLLVPGGVAYYTLDLLSPFAERGAKVAAFAVLLIGLAVEVVGIVGWLGRLFERTEPTETSV